MNKLKVILLYVIIGLIVAVGGRELVKASNRKSAIDELKVTAASSPKDYKTAVQRASDKFGENRSLFRFMTSSAHKGKVCNDIDNGISAELAKDDTDWEEVVSLVELHDRLNCGDDHAE